MLILYLQTLDLEERMLMQFAVSLEVRDMLRLSQKPAGWSISTELKVFTYLSPPYPVLTQPTAEEYQSLHQTLPAFADNCSLQRKGL